MKFLMFFFVVLVTMGCPGQNQTHDLVIQNATLFNSRTGKTIPGQSILINGDKIVAVTGPQQKLSAKKIIDAKGKLVTPGFIDTHIHPTDVFGDYAAAPEYLVKDSLQYFREKLSGTYLPYGVTTAMIMGQPEKWLPPILDWLAHPSSAYLDIYTVGGALISKESRQPYINHITVESPAAARQKILDYYKLGIRHIKLYWRLRRPEFEAAFKTADSLGMRLYGHIDQNIMYMDTAMDIGLHNFEHLLTLDNTVLHFQKDGPEFGKDMQKNYASSNTSFPVVRLEMFRFIHDKRPAEMKALINKLAAHKASISTTIHLMAEQFGLTYYSEKKDTSLNKEQLARCKENFRLFMAYAKQLYDKGVQLRIGTDCENGGKAFLSEQLLLFEYGFSIPAILQISTINGAAALGLDNKYGIIEKGKKANILIWDKSPFDDYKNFLSAKTIIKDGVVYKN